MRSIIFLCFYSLLIVMFFQNFLALLIHFVQIQFKLTNYFDHIMSLWTN